jgi:hypothetical protein
MEDLQLDRQLIQMLLTRLERISADSYWAHRASGIRGGLLRMLEEFENNRPVPKSETKRLVEMGFSILENATLEKFK